MELFHLENLGLNDTVTDLDFNQVTESFSLRILFLGIKKPLR